MGTAAAFPAFPHAVEALDQISSLVRVYIPRWRGSEDLIAASMLFAFPYGKANCAFHLSLVQERQRVWAGLFLTEERSKISCPCQQ